MHQPTELTRLERAMAAFLRHRVHGGDADAFLAGHPDLRDLLEPMVRGAPDVEMTAETVLGGDFRLERELGRGGMGVVYSGWQLSLGRRVAVKVLANHVTLLPATVTRFRREAQIIAGLDHPGIVKVLAVGDDDDQHWFAMELVDGETLDGQLADLRQRGAAPAATTRRMVELAVHLAEALHHAHAQGVVHRDVKPSNVMVRAGGAPVLTDFGLARVARDPAITLAGARTGTPCYMAPEQVDGRVGAVDPRTDVFALGATLYEMLTFRRAFDADSSDAAIRKVIEVEPVDPRRRNPAVSRDLAAVVAMALEKDPARRYRSAAAFAADLRACLEHRSVLARQPGTLARLGRWAKRQPARAALAVGLAIGVPTLTALLGYIVARAPLVRAGEARRLDELIEQGLYLVFHRHRDHAEAQRVLGRAAVLAPDSPEVVIATAAMQSRWVGNVAALAVLDERPGLLVQHRELRRARALYLRALDRIAEAEAIETELGAPRSAFEFFFAGLAAWHQRPAGAEHAARALRHLSLATRVSPRPRLGMVLCYANVADTLGDPGAQQEAALTLVTVWPESPRALGHAAWIQRDADPQWALTVVDRSLRLVPGDPGLLHTRARILENLGDVAAAIAELERAVRADPDFTEAAVDLARLR